MKLYMLVDGNGHYIRRDRHTNRYVQVNRMENADTWESFDKAERVRRSALDRNIKHRFYCITVERSDAQKAQACTAEAEAHVESARYADSDEIERKIMGFLQCAESLFSRKEELLARESTVDKEISDLQHYIEQRNLNARDGFKVYKRLQDVLIRRRGIKDELLILDIIRECRMEPESIAKTIVRIQGLASRKYMPRVLTDIFEKGVV